MRDQREKDRLIGMLLTDKKFADAVFADPSGVLTELGFGRDEIEAVARLPQEKFRNLADTLDSRLTQDQATSSKHHF